MKKAAVMLYPLFSMQEISCTTELFKFYDKETVTIAAGREPVKSEDGFTILPDRDFAGFDREEFDSLLLPGIWEPLPVLLDERNIRFLEQFRGEENLVIAAMSSSPLLLGKAGLLEGRRFTSGVYEEFLDAFPVMPREGIVRRYLVEDGNLITTNGEDFLRCGGEGLAGGGFHLPCAAGSAGGVPGGLGPEPAGSERKIREWDGNQWYPSFFLKGKGSKRTLRKYE